MNSKATMNIFAHQEINKSRQYEFDLIKALTIVLMIWTHVYENLSTGFEPSLSHFNAYYRGCLFGASTFMFCMGIGMVYTRSSAPKDYLKRGIHLFFTAILLNFFRVVLSGTITGRYIFDPPSATYLVLAVGSDILYFADLAFLLMALLRKLGLRYRHILTVSVLLSASAYFLEGVGSRNFFLNQAMGFLWGNFSESYFPLFNWFIFVAAGCLFGKLYLHINDKAKFHKICFPAGLVVTAAYLFIYFNVDQNIFLQFDDSLYLGHRRLPDAVMTILANIWLISLFYYIGKAIPQKAMPVLVHPSKHINQYYCISWFFIMLAYFSLFYDNPLSDDSGVLTVWPVVLVVTMLTVIVYDKWLKMPITVFFGKHHTFWVTLVIVVTLCAAYYGYSLCDGLYPTFLNGYNPW